MSPRSTMMKLPPTTLNAYLVRTWFGGGDAAWRSIVEILRTPLEAYSGYLAGIEAISNPGFDGFSPDRVRSIVAPTPWMGILTIADETTLTTPEWPILLLSIIDPVAYQPFRCTARALPLVECNIGGNTSWEEYTDRLDDTAVYRGFA